MAERVAVMDLGTNTFHLLIAEKTELDFKTICHLENSAKLGEGGMANGSINPQAFERGVIAMQEFKKALDEHLPRKIKAIGTSALRSANNGAEFIKKVRQDTGIQIESIDGETEARYIFQGVKTSGVLGDKISLILDIGGGSIEFIIANQHQLFWKRSYEIGAARLMDKFHLSDPIHPDEIKNLERYLDDVLPEVYEAAGKYQVQNVIGSSGAFETFSGLAELSKGNILNLKQIKNYPLETTLLKQILEQLITSTHEQRAANNQIIPVRVDMIVVASVVTRYLMQKLGIEEVAMSVYSLKEGVLAEMLY